MKSGEQIWGPTFVGGRARSRRRVVLASVALVITAAIGLVVLTTTLYNIAEGNLERVDLPALEPRDVQPEQPMNVLVVGSDSRAGLSRDEIRRLRLGAFDVHQADAVLIVSIAHNREVVSVVALPRDLLVTYDGRQRKLADTLHYGSDDFIGVVQAATGVPIHHYVEVSIPGFLNIVEALGTIEICLESSLRDWRANANFAAGCHDMGPEEALAIVRSRATQLGDFDRIERQQKFMRAVIDEMLSAGTLVDLPKLFEVVERVSRHVTTDSGLDRTTMTGLARELRHVARGDVPMTTLPAYASTIGGVSYVVAYEPGAEAIYEALRRGEPIPPRGVRAERLETKVVVWSSGDSQEDDRVTRTLQWSAFAVNGIAGRAPMTVEETTVFATPEATEQAEWVAAVLGATVRPLPQGVEIPNGADVAVALVAPAPSAAGDRGEL